MWPSKIVKLQIQQKLKSPLHYRFRASFQRNQLTSVFFSFYPFYFLFFFSHQPNNVFCPPLNLNVNSQPYKLGFPLLLPSILRSTFPLLLERNMSASLQVSTDSSLSAPSLPAKTDGHNLLDPECHAPWFVAVLVVFSVLFVVYLAAHAKKNLKKLYTRRSYVTISYYALLWLVTALNLGWSSLQVLPLPPFVSNSTFSLLFVRFLCLSCVVD